MSLPIIGFNISFPFEWFSERNVDMYEVDLKRGWNKIVFKRTYPRKPIVLVESSIYWSVRTPVIDLKSISLREIKISFPTIRLPEFKTPPVFTIPTLNVPPAYPVNIRMPDFKLPDFRLPDFDPEKTLNDYINEGFLKCVSEMKECDFIKWFCYITNPLTVETCRFAIAGLICSIPDFVFRSAVRFVYDYANELTKWAKNFRSSLASMYSDFANSINSFLSSLISNFNEIRNFSGQVSLRIDDIRKNFEQLTNTLKDVKAQFDNVNVNLKNIIDVFSKFADDLNSLSSDFKKMVDDLNANFNTLKTGFNDLVNFSRNLIGSFEQGGLTMGYAPAVVRNVTESSCEIYSPADCRARILVVY